MMQLFLSLFYYQVPFRILFNLFVSLTAAAELIEIT